MVTPPPVFSWLPCTVDRHIHAVRDPGDPYPKAVCGAVIIPDIYIYEPFGPCRRCAAKLPKTYTLRPVSGERHLVAKHPGVFLAIERWWLCHRYDWRIRRELAAQRTTEKRKGHDDDL